MLAKSSAEVDNSADNQSHPVIRTLYDHAEEVTCLEFHPSATVLVSGSKDNNLKMFDYGKASVKKAHKVINVSLDYFHCKWVRFILKLFESSFWLRVRKRQTVHMDG